jgi:hypothetical protein
MLVRKPAKAQAHKSHKMTRMTFACAVYSKFPPLLDAPPVAPTLFPLPFCQYQFHPPARTSDVPTPTVTITHPNLSGHLTFDEQ